MDDHLRIVIVCEHASLKFGGEAALPLHYFRVLRERGLPVWLVTHARTRADLERLFPGESRILYIEDSNLHRFLWRLQGKLPAQLANFTIGFVSRVDVQIAQRRLVRRLAAEHGISVVHQPMPVSPREPSMMYGLGIPVVIGPMNGGMNYPAGFRHLHPRTERWALLLGRWSSALMNRLIPGKRRAAFLLVANERTRRALPSGASTKVIELVENGADLTLWRPADDAPDSDTPAATFAFVGRLVGWKAVDLLLEAFHVAARRAPMRLRVIGDGDQRPRLESMARNLGVLEEDGSGEPGRVSFAGWLSQESCAHEVRRMDCLVLPSLLECGGAVVLEAMSTGKPVIATAWGGPADYLDARCGILVPPTDRDALIAGFAEAMVKLASSPELRREMGRAGREKVIREYDWEVKVDRILEIYRTARDLTGK